jgi:YidC/Oxa1 family membrane protein insertase
MEKNAILAIVLSLLVLVAFQYLSPKQTPPPTRQSAPQEDAKPLEETRPLSEEESAAQTKPPTPVRAEEEIISVETELYSARLSSIGGTIKSWELKKYFDEKGMNVSLLSDAGSPYRALGIGLGEDFGLSDANYVVKGGDIVLEGSDNSGSLKFEYSDGRYSIKRTYTFYSDGYHFDLVDEVTGPTQYQITLGATFGIHQQKEDRLTHMGPVLLEDTKRIEIKAKKIQPGEARLYSDNVKWIAIEDKYFFSAIAPITTVDNARTWRSRDSVSIALSGRPGVNEYLVYAGPKDLDRLKALERGIEHVVDFGFFSIIARPIFWLLKQFHKLVGNYGWAIVLLTIVIRVPFIPIMHKGQKSMKKLQQLQPRMKEIREQYKKDQQKMQQEMMALYKKHKVNPMGGCLPLLLQIPVFFALYKVLLIAIELRGAPWMLWITDLSQKDPFYILPIVMGVTMLLQQKMTPATGDPRQQKMMMFMPIIFTFLFLGFASGLVLYWLVNNLLSIAQQVYVNKKTD